VRQPNSKRSSGVFYAEPIQQRILVVDDDLGLREMISTALGMRGADVVAVGNAEAALAQQGPFAVAIVDLLLPDMRGDALIGQLRSAGIAELGILVTGTELPAQLAARGKPDVVLRKPFELEELFEALASVLGNQSADRSAAS
jgi:CheY-like chemotaxis protein